MVSVPHQSLPGAVGCQIHLDSGDDIDYVMYGKDGKPLAIVEYTATCRSPIEGRTKAIDKANQLAKKYGYKPIAYYTNGYFIFVISWGIGPDGYSSFIRSKNWNCSSCGRRFAKTFPIRR